MFNIHNPSIKAYDPAIDALSTLEKKDFVKYLGVIWLIMNFLGKTILIYRKNSENKPIHV